MPLTSNQQTAVRNWGNPLFIQAGAGTGKTFTLTQRLAYGLSAESGPLLPSVENLLTITFTEKAAAELLGRVRAELRVRGLAQAALEIDGAWISTIHSMCKRILMTHALEAGIDPCAQMLSEEESAALLGQAIEEMLQQKANAPQLKLLLGVLESEDTCALVKDLASRLELMPEGPAGLCLGPSSGKPSLQPVVSLLSKINGILGEVQDLGGPDTATCAKVCDKMEQAAQVLEQFLQQVDASQLTWSQLLEAVQQCPVCKSGRVKAHFKPLFDEFYESMVEVKAATAAAATRERLDAALELAQGVCARHLQLKRAEGAIDTNDLLIETYRLFEVHPELAQLYAQRFKCVMVDEFQDTDQLQVQIVKRLCDPQLSALATVGDAQQSIYGFRGADLEVYRAMRREMQQHASREVALDMNFRSHPDILGFVRCVFQKEGFFGNEFLDVKPGPQNARAHKWAPEGTPRVKLLLAAGNKAEKGSGCTSVVALRQASAEMIAEQLEQLGNQGASYGDMAILMRTTKSAGPVMAELRKRGIPCIISGGSTFYTLEEVKALVMFLRVLENCDDDEALFSLLGSAMIDISDDEFLVLADYAKRKLFLATDDSRPRSSYFDALKARVKKDGQAASPALVQAYNVLEHAFERLGTDSLSLVVMRAVAESGWAESLRKQGAQGMAVMANLQRFCDLLDEFQAQNGSSVLKAAEHFRTLCTLAESGAGGRGKPGAMVTFGNDAVRIMTIHASKGLEFPITVVAEYENSSRAAKSTSVLSLTEDGSAYATLPPDTNGEGKDYLKSFFNNEEDDVAAFAQANDVAQYQRHALLLAKEREKQEEQRLFYVALTRARDMLILAAHDARFMSKGELGSGLTADMVNAAIPDGLPTSDAVIALEDGPLVEYAVRDVPYVAADGQAESEQDAPQDGIVLHRLVCDVPAAPVAAQFDEPPAIRSYSSISKQTVEQPDAFVALPKRQPQPETVSLVGSAFHLVAQWMAQQENAEVGLQQRMQAAARKYALDAEEQLRLQNAVSAWKDSERFSQAVSYSRRYCEHAFCVDVQGMALEGSIDLLCVGNDNTALIIDYKTGVSGQGTDLHDRYRLQAQCYAYAVLASGLCSDVELVFVRPEAELEEVNFAFNAQDLESLAASILEQRQ